MHHSTESAASELAAMSEHLQDYLLDERLYKTITVPSEGGDRLIKMTIGAMLERLDELSSQSDGTIAGAVSSAQDALALARRSQPDRFYEMIGREAKSYTDSWNWFLQNCWEGDPRCRSDYAQEVGVRVRLERLLQEAGDHTELAESRARIRSLDDRLRAIWQAQDEPLMGSREQYPSDRYWWLYGQPAPSDS